MTFQEFQKHNQTRSKTLWPREDWPIQNWFLAIAGEAGEGCNLVKKVIKGDFTLEEKREEILKELADIITYCDLAISCLDGKTDEVVLNKFNEVSRRNGYEVILHL